MKGIDPLAASAPLATSLRATSESLGELYYEPAVVLGAGVVSGANLIATTRVPVVEFPKGGTTIWRWNHRMRQGWRRAGVIVDYEYASPVGAATDFRITISVQVTLPGSVLIGLSNRAGAFQTIPAHAVAGTVQAARQVFAAPVLPASASEVSLTFARLSGDAADTNPNSLYLTSFRVEFASGGA